jgi:multidrug transporter EmrE-like cation transporter
MAIDYKFWLILAVTAFAAYYAFQQVRLMRKMHLPLEQASTTSFRHYWPLALMVLLLGANWITYFAARSTLPIGNCKTLLTGWGISGNSIFAAIETDALINYEKTSRLMFISRVADHTIDGKLDKGIVKSGAFGIRGGALQIQAAMPDDFMKHAISASGGWLEFHVVMVPKGIQPEKIASLADVDNVGGRDLESRGYMIPAPLVPVAQTALEAAY